MISTEGRGGGKETAIYLHVSHLLLHRNFPSIQEENLTEKTLNALFLTQHRNCLKKLDELMLNFPNTSPPHMLTLFFALLHEIMAKTAF